MIRNEPVFWTDGETFAKFYVGEYDKLKRQGKKLNYEDEQFINFVNEHIIHVDSLYAFVFNSTQEINDAKYFGGVKEVFRDNHWVILVGDVAFGVSYCTTYVFKLSNNGNLILVGIAGGNPITSKGWALSYCVKDSLFVLYDNDTVLFCKEIKTLL